MDPATDLLYLKKLLMITQKHYQNPREEAMTFKKLWTYDNTLSKEMEKEMARNFFEEAKKLNDDSNEPAENVLAVIRKGLRMDPRSHKFYALRGEIYAKKRDWQKAIKWFDTARNMLKFDKNSKGETVFAKYKEQLINAYRGRGDWYESNGKLIEAVADYEQILILNPKKDQIFEIQDMLLKCLRKLEKYEAYCLAWSEFMKDAKPQRISDLITQHAEYKIHTREVAAARRMLREALSLDENNIEAQDLLQVIFDTGHTMLAYAVIWCINGCYDKALMTIDKGSDCDPYNPGFTVLKTIVLRLSGRLKEAMRWLENVNKSFHKLLEPSLDKRGSIMGSLSVNQTKPMLINQWYLIRYDMAMENVMKGKYEEALKLLDNEKLLKKFGESRLLIGDCYMRQGKLGDALKAYLKTNEEIVSTGYWDKSKKKYHIAQRVTEILNSQSRQAVQKKDIKKALRKAEESMNVLRKEKIPISRLGNERSEALMYMARSIYQQSDMKSTYSCLKNLADSLAFGRGVDDGGLRNSLLGDHANLEKSISCFGSKNKFPFCSKILMEN